MAISSLILSSPLADTVSRLEALSGAFYWYEPFSGSPLADDSISMCRCDRYSGELSRSLGSSLTALSPLEALCLIAEERLWHKTSIVWLSDFCLSGDYCGGSHYLSNLLCLLEEHGNHGVRECYGSYSSLTLSIDPRFCSEELLQALEALESYPIHDENHWSSISRELQDKEWDLWAAREFSQKLSERLSSLLPEALEEEAEDAIESLSSDALYALFREAQDLSNTYWENEQGSSYYIDCERLSEALSEESLLSLLSEAHSKALSQALAPLHQESSEALSEAL
jgi:hypothetical protein